MKTPPRVPNIAGFWISGGIINPCSDSISDSIMVIVKPRIQQPFPTDALQTIWLLSMAVLGAEPDFVGSKI